MSQSRKQLDALECIGRYSPELEEPADFFFKLIEAMLLEREDIVAVLPALFAQTTKLARAAGVKSGRLEEQENSPSSRAFGDTVRRAAAAERLAVVEIISAVYENASRTGNMSFAFNQALQAIRGRE